MYIYVYIKSYNSFLLISGITGAGFSAFCDACSKRVFKAVFDFKPNSCVILIREYPKYTYSLIRLKNVSASWIVMFLILIRLFPRLHINSTSFAMIHCYKKNYFLSRSNKMYIIMHICWP